jgi:hypothetical protein
MYLLNAVDFMRERVEQRNRVLDAFRSRLEQVMEEQPSATSAYDVVTEAGQVDADSYSTTSVEAADSSAGMNYPSNRMLYSIFEEMDEDDFTKNGYPKVSVVNDLLEDRGHYRADKETIDASFDRWWHHEKGEGGDEGEERPHKGASKKPTQKALFSIFEKLDRRKGDDEYFTEDKFPRVSAVNEELEKKGHAPANQKSIHRAYKAWEEEEEMEEPRHGRS